MADAARAFFDSLTGYPAIEDLVRNGEAEGPHLECKSPASPTLKGEIRVKLAEAVSGFANSGGGVILWGVSTTSHAHSGLDVISQLEPMGGAKPFALQVDRAVRTLSNPSLDGSEFKVFHPDPAATRGVVATYVPATSGDPVQSVIDGNFYLRSGDSFSEMPYEILKRMFTSTSAPDLRPVFDERLVKIDPKGAWTIPILLSNESTAAADRATVMVKILNPDACQSVTPAAFRDASEVNPGDRIFVRDFPDALYRGLNQHIGDLVVVMKTGKQPRRVLTLRITIYSNRMRAHRWEMRVQLAKKGFSVTEIRSADLY